MEAIFRVAYQPYLTRKIPSITVLRTLNVYFDFFKKDTSVSRINCVSALLLHRGNNPKYRYLPVYIRAYVFTNSNDYYLFMCINVSTLEHPIVIVLLSQKHFEGITTISSA